MANRAAQFRAANPDLTVTRRGRRSIEFQQPDGSRRLITTIEPLHYGAGNAEIDTAWQAAAAPWAWQMLSSDYQVRALSRLNNGQVIQWADPTSGQTLTLQPMALNWVNTANDALQQISMPQAVEAVAEDDRLRWANGYGSGRHFRYTAHPTSLIKELVIDAASNLPAPTVANPALELSFILGYSSGVTLWVDGAQWDRSTKITTANEIEFRLSGGAVAWRMVRPGAVDSAGSTCAGLFQLRRSGSSRYVTVRIPKTWLDAAVYPVTIDPTLTTPQTAAAVADTMILAGYATTNFGTWEYGLQTGRDSSNSCRMLFEFDISEIAAGATISSATFSMKCVYLDSGAGSRAHSIYELRSGRAGWSETQATWNIYSTGNNWSTAGADNTTSDRQSSTLATFNSPASSNNWVDVSLSTSAVAGWCGSSNSNYGFLVVMTPEANYTKTSWQSSDGSTSADRPYLTVVYTNPATNLVVADTAHAHAADAPTLTQTHILTVADGSHGAAVDELTLTQAHILALADTAHGQTVDSPTLTQAHNLAVADAAHSHAADTVTLTQAHNLTAADASHAQGADSPALTQVHALQADDAAHAHSADSPALTQVHTLAGLADTAHAHAVDAVSLTQTHILAVADAAHGHTADNVTIEEESTTVTLTVADAGHGHAADAVALTQVHLLALADAAHAQTAEVVTLTQAHALTVDDASHGQAAGSLALTQTHILTVADASHAQTADVVSLSGEATLTVADAGHTQTAGEVTLTQAHTLVVQGVAHAHAADSATLVQVHTLVVQDAAHAHVVDELSMIMAIIAVTVRLRSFTVSVKHRGAGVAVSEREFDATASERATTVTARQREFTFED